MASKSRAVSINVSEISELADAVGKLDPASFNRSASEAINAVLDRTYDLARGNIAAGINLSDDYLRRRMEVAHATESKPEGSITATGDRGLMTRLARYDAAMRLVPRKTTSRSRSKGLLPIPSGSKQAGVDVTVRRGSAKTLSTGFMLTLRSGAVSGEKFGVFVRENKRLKHLYGPSVYQLFGHQIKTVADDVADDLRDTLLDSVERNVENLLK